MKQHISFPSIEQFRNVIKTVRERSNWYAFPVPSITFIGTVKLHGTNASVCCLADQPTEFWAQSRSNIITPENDNAGFATWTESRRLDIVMILDIAQAVFNFKKNTYANDIISVYGEWCGQGIQKGVAVSQLPKMFVIFGISVFNTQEPDKRVWFTAEQVKTVVQLFRIRFNPADIRCIYDYPTWEKTINFNIPEAVQNELGQLTEEVEAKCPVGLAHGVTGIGEGIVWAAQRDVYNLSVPFPTDDLIFKVKGKKHSVSKVRTLASVDVEKVNSINEFVDSVVTEARLQQGLAILKEQGLEDTIENTGAFLKWIGQDILKEESDTIEANGLERKDVMPQISRIARQWYIQYQQGKPL